MTTDIVFDSALVRKYDRPGPRYTSYPTAPQFREDYTEAVYRDMASLSNGDFIPKPLSIYVHVPFCESLCFYCACNKIITRHRDKAERYLQYLLKEIELQGALFDPDRQVVQLHLGGGTPTYFSGDQMDTLLGRLREHFWFAAGEQGEFSIEIDPRTVTPEDVERLLAQGFNRMSLGVQDFDPDVQKAVNRIQSELQVAAVTEAARRGGVRSISYDLIYGLPKQTLETFGETLDKVIALAPDRLSVYNYAHLPHLVKAQRLIKDEDLPSPDLKLAILQLTIRRLTEAGYVYIGMDHFARADDSLAKALADGSLQRNFQGYSTHADCDLIGLGTTAIGKISDSYSQNLRHVNAYYARLDEGRLPLARGLVLTKDDLLRRDVINTLMCQGELNFRAVEFRHGIRFRKNFEAELQQLRPMEADGLLTIGQDKIAVEPLGRLMLRNICMVFDRYLRPAEQLFSRTV